MQDSGPYSYIRRRRTPAPRRLWLGCAGVLVGALLLALLVYQIPFVKSRLSWRIDNLVSQVHHIINPPEEVIFNPSGLRDPAIQITSKATATPATNQPAGTPFPTFEPNPPAVVLDGVVYVDQHGRWNYCGPANLAMALNYWGWSGDRDEVAREIKPGQDNPNMDFVEQGKIDKNVMPYEMENFVTEFTQFGALTRVGGDIELIKRVIARGFPVVVEKGYYEADYRGIVDWLGHYLFVTGYDDEGGYFVVQDAYLKTGDNGTGANLQVAYQDFIDQWRSFNYLFLVVYPPEQEADLLDALGPWADDVWANQNALQVAKTEAETLTSIDQYFAWFNVGTSHVRLFEYVDAAYAYDYTFQLYNALDDSVYKRPFRMTWYQTGPYFAYYYSGFYKDVIDLANRTLYDWSSEPTLEESLYWRGMAYYALGETGNAVGDFQETVRINPKFDPGWAMLAELGISQ